MNVDYRGRDAQRMPATEGSALIRVVGVGGGGSNAVNRMIAENIAGVEFVAVNTDQQALLGSHAPMRIAIGERTTRGLGSGGDPDTGARAAEESLEELRQSLSGSDMVFVTAGMGGGTGTGAAPVIAQLAREEGCLTVGVVTKPFFFEGKQRSRRADIGLQMLAEHVDTLPVLHNTPEIRREVPDDKKFEIVRRAVVYFRGLPGVDVIDVDGGLVM